MNWGIFLIESIVLCVLFTIMIVSRMRKPLITIIYSYPPAIVDRVIELGLIQDYNRTTSNTIKALKKKWPAIIVFGMLLGTLVFFVNHARGFTSGFLTSYSLWLVVDWYDALILDIVWFCHSKHVRIAGTEDMIEAYHDYWFHIKGSLLGMVLGLPACLIAGLFCYFLTMIIA